MATVQSTSRSKGSMLLSLSISRTVHYQNVFELDRISHLIQRWNSTKKLAILYGIASCMSCLHSQEIVCRTLKPSSICLGEIIISKLGDFEFSAEFETSRSITIQSISGAKATPINSSPDVLLSDVYAFGLITYEIICNEVPFNEMASSFKVFHEAVFSQKRPVIKESIPLSYRKLI